MESVSNMNRSGNMLKILAVKVCSNPMMNKFIYEKNNTLYVRSGEDDFIKGYGLQTTLDGACAKWGFYKMDKPIEMRDGQDLYDNSKYFHLTNRGTIEYNQPLFRQ